MIDATEHLKVIEAKNADARIDSRILAEHLGVQSETVMRLLKNYTDDFKAFGILRFEIGEIVGRGQPEKFAMLNEDQCYLLTAQMIAAAAMRGAADHKEGYAKAKAALGGLESLVKVGAEERVALP